MFLYFLYFFFFLVIRYTRCFVVVCNIELQTKQLERNHGVSWVKNTCFLERNFIRLWTDHGRFLHIVGVQIILCIYLNKPSDFLFARRRFRKNERKAVEKPKVESIWKNSFSSIIVQYYACWPCGKRFIGINIVSLGFCTNEVTLNTVSMTGSYPQYIQYAYV